MFSSVSSSRLILRDLSEMRDEMSRASHSVSGSCADLSNTLHRRQNSAALALERGTVLREQLERQLREMLAEVTELQSRTEQLNARLGRRARSAGDVMSSCGEPVDYRDKPSVLEDC